MRRFPFLLLLPVLMIVVMERGPRPVAAHAELVRSDPSSEGVLAVPPGKLNLWFSEAIAAGGGSPSIQLLDRTGAALPALSPRVDAADAAHVTAALPTLTPSVFTVVWSVRSATDGHALGGSYAFRVGAGRVPGAATVAGERPRAWAVATRWLTFLGAALAAGGFAFAVVILRPGDDHAAGVRPRTALTMGAPLIGLLASLSEPYAQTRRPPAGLVAPTMHDSIAGLPTAWWLRPAGLLVALVCAFLVARSARRNRFAPGRVAWIGLAASLGALFELALTSHAAGRARWRWAAVGSDLLHQISVALWAGGLIQLAVW